MNAADTRASSAIADCTPETVVSLQLEPETDRGQARLDRDARERSAREPETVEERIEPIGELDLVPLCSAKELDAREPLRMRV